MNIKKILFILSLSIISFNAYSSEWHANYQHAFDTCNAQFSNCSNGSGVPNVNCINNTPYKYWWNGNINNRHFYCPQGLASPNAACPYPQSDGSCSNSPSNCPNGASAQFSLPEDNIVNGLLQICIGSCTRTANYNGCEYVVTGHSDDCFYDTSLSPPAYSCNYTGTANGSTASSSLPTTSPPNPNVNSTPSSCTDMNGLDICKASSTDCAMVNGQEVCVVTDTECGLLNGKKVCANDPQNCGYLNGKYVCIEPDGSTNASCISNGTNKVCISDETAVTSTETTSITTNADNSTTTTTTNSSNVLDSTPVVSATTLNTDGSSSTVQTGVDSVQLDTDSLNSIESNTDQTSKNTKKISDNTKSIDDKLTQILDTSGSQASSDTALGQVTSAIDNDAAAMANEITNTSNPFSGMANTLVSDWIPDLPVPTCSGVIDTQIFGRQFYLDPCDKLQPLRVTLEWVFYVLAAVSVFNTIFTIRSS